MEGLAAFGTAVNVLTLIDMACKTVSRIQEYTDRASEIPESLRSTQLCLPLLADFLNNAKAKGLYDQIVVRNVLIEFSKRLEAIEKEAQRIIPLPTDTRRRRWSKALVSLQAEGRIQRAEKDIAKYEQKLTLWIVGSGCTSMGLAKVSMPKRDKFFNYEGCRPWFRCTDSGVFQGPKFMEEEYNAVATTLLLRRQEVMGTAIAMINFDYLSPDNTHCTSVECLGSEMKMAGHAEVIFYLDLLQCDNKNTIDQYLHSLRLPDCSSQEEGWDTLKAVLEEWQRPFLLFVDASLYGKISDEERALFQHVLSNLPQSKSGFVVVIDRFNEISGDASGGLTYHPVDWPTYVIEDGFSDDEEISDGTEDDSAEEKEEDASSCDWHSCLESEEQVTEVADHTAPNSEP